MKKILYLLLIVPLLIGLISCKSAKTSKYAASDESIITSKNSLDWDGSYYGILPCADCEGIQKTITLDSNGNYRLVIKYLGKEDSSAEYKGYFMWNREGNTITISETGDEPVSYFVADGALAQLDMNGNKITGPLAANYILSKEKFSLLRKYWKLTELNGRSINIDAGFGKEPHIVFKLEDNRFSGNAGCNNFSGTYQLTGIHEISFSEVVSTMMACPSMDLESGFLRALKTADNYHITDDNLLLSKAGIVTLARFKTVYIKEKANKDK